MKVIIVTGTPGTGKTVVARRTARQKGCRYVDVNKLIRTKKLYDSYDRKRKAFDVDTKKLNKFLIKLILEEKGKRTKCLVLDSHLTHYLPSRYVDLCIETKTDLKKLKKRLEKRGYPRQKIRENMDAEIFDVCLNEAKEEGHKIKIVRT